MSAPTFLSLLADQADRSGSRPLVSFYDDSSGERVELSVVTYANWVAKTAGLLQEELELERGGSVLLDLPTHWLGPIWLGAAWSMGLSVTPDPSKAAEVDLVVCGPDSVDRYAAMPRPVVASALLPMGARFTTPLPDGVVDFGVVVWTQPDTFAPYDPPEGTDVAWRSGTTVLTQGELVEAAAASELGAPGTRLLTDVNPATATGLTCLVGPLAAGGGTVWVRHPDPEGWERRAEAEQVTRQLRRGDPTTG